VKRLRPLEAVNGILMMAMTVAALRAILQDIIRSRADAIVAGRRRRRGSGE